MAYIWGSGVSGAGVGVGVATFTAFAFRALGRAADFRLLVRVAFLAFARRRVGMGFCL
jgi:hypothetical protein